MIFPDLSSMVLKDVKSPVSDIYMRARPFFHEGEEPLGMYTYSLIAIRISLEIKIKIETALYSRKKSVIFKLFFPMNLIF